MRRHVGLALECGLLLFLGSAAVGMYWLSRSGPLEGVPLLMTAAVPACASLILVGLSMLVPTLFAVNGMRFPLNVTLPLVHTALIFMALVLFTSSKASIQRLPEPFEVVLLWSETRALATSLAAGIVLLSLVVAFHHWRPQPKESV